MRAGPCFNQGIERDLTLSRCRTRWLQRFGLLKCRTCAKIIITPEQRQEKQYTFSRRRREGLSNFLGALSKVRQHKWHHRLDARRPLPDLVVRTRLRNC